MKYSPTEEQQLIVNEVLKNTGNIILVDAVAGSGKSSTARLIVNTVKPKKGLYTAFNKAIIEEGEELFPSNMECKTLHALALSYVKPKFGIDPFTYLCIKERLSYRDKGKIIKAMDEFYKSDSSDVYSYIPGYLDNKKLVPITIKYIEEMFNDKRPVTFNYLLKHFHLMLKEGLIDPGYDLVILDECQDTVAVSLEIFKLLKADTKIGLGDRYQAIYDFMKLVSAFKLLTEATVFSLTKSFRCSTLIAERVDLYGKRELSEDFTFKGTTTPEEDGKTAYITATNASIIKRIKLLHEEDKGYVLTKNLKDIFACPLALATASSGKPVMHRQYKFLDREYKNYTMSKYKSFFKYLKKEVYDEEVHGAIELLTQLKQQNINIFTVLKDAKNAKRDSNLLVATYFSAKGLGFETVHIEKDLNYAMDKALKAKQDETMTESHFTTLKGYYVACTRARVHLHNATHL